MIRRREMKQISVSLRSPQMLQLEKFAAKSELSVERAVNELLEFALKEKAKHSDRTKKANQARKAKIIRAKQPILGAIQNLTSASMNLKKIGREIQRLRVANKFTLETIAEAAVIDPATLAEIEKGKSPSGCNLVEFYRISGILGYPLSSVLAFEDKQTSKSQKLVSDSEFLQVLGKEVRRIREKKGISQEQFSEKAAINRVIYTLLENGNRSISIENLYSIADHLEIDAVKIIKNIESAIKKSRKVSSPPT